MSRRAEQHDRAIGSLLGLAIGDAVGTSVEFKQRDSFPPLEDMVGGGPFGLRPGEWTDDTSMALCLADALLAKQGAFDARAVLGHFLNWYRHGHNSVTVHCFDIGNATRVALVAYETTASLINNLEEDLQANGSIMRLPPAIICARSEAEAVEIACSQRRTTHAAAVPTLCCAELARDLWYLVETGDFPGSALALRTGERSSITSTGHAPATLEAARWAVATTGTFRDAILAAANLGGDADTVAAVAGQLAGARYGMAGMPQEWLVRLAWRDEIENRANALWKLRFT